MTIPLAPKLTTAKKEAALPIHFIVVGGGIAGLSCAVALRRVGHRVTVLERHPDVFQAVGGCRMAPNLSKILFHWGLENECRRIGELSKGIDFRVLESGEHIGQHTWDEEVIRETRGEFLFTYHADLRKLLYDTAVGCGADIRMGVAVTDVDPDNQRVKLATGEVIQGDAIIGADGVNGLTRKLMVELDREPDHRNNLYSTVVSRDAMMRDPELRKMISERKNGMFAWFGDERSALAFPMGGREHDFALLVYCPVDGNESSWDDSVPLEALQKVLANAEPRLQRLVKLAIHPPACVAVKNYELPDDWVHESGKLLIVGEAVHPLPPGCIQEAAMPLEDAAVLAKLFSHIRNKDQIPTLLSAFQDLRTPRLERVLNKEIGDVMFMTLPPGPQQDGRNAHFTARRDAGVSVFDALPGSAADEEELPQWLEIKDTFGYDAEDDADNWWMEWGLLRERAKGRDLTDGFVNPAMVSVQTGVSTTSCEE
ncbi:hypothetical protein CC1G_08083 [Coprinopsis cinerea okayama7|uniref:FAD-binding domain-containing protein n=1 Tax=Coprinopsis cinerea (strain Okayama-7 / 130 / ATCC MYA-4618 / FGSC 9003) TaxID=240176 RepID=A8NVP6_COPC7|nr:hypothetical protein CC1G_08083 [Coprinopsis cinerea okayama7\|eukprot:XP_001836698.2 hypothetical protein CC1G_08083 [Coprinopsis cinerea okayama7\